MRNKCDTMETIFKACSMKKLLFFTFITLSFTCFSRTFYVSQENHYWQNQYFYNKISVAIANADYGDTLLVAPGWYDNDFFIINKKIVILGCQAGAGFRSENSRGNIESIITFSGNPEAFLLINAAETVIDGVKFGDDNMKIIGGIYINAPKVTIRNCLLINTLSSGIFISSKANNTIIQNNYFINNYPEAVLNNASSVEISNNYFNCPDNYSSIGSSKKIIIRSNFIDQSSGYGIVLYGDEAVLSQIYSNRIFNNKHLQIIKEIEDNDQIDNEGLAADILPVPQKTESFFDNQLIKTDFQLPQSVNLLSKNQIYTIKNLSLVKVPDTGFKSCRGVAQLNKTDEQKFFTGFTSLIKF